MKKTLLNLNLKALFFLICIIQQYYSYAGEYEISRMPFAKQLPSEQITTMHQDKEGFIWIGTPHGIARFDGNETIVLKSDYNNPTLLSDNYITCIKDNETFVCVGTKKGFNLINKENGSIKQTENNNINNTEIKSIITYRNDNIVILAGNIIYLCDKNGNITKQCDFFAQRNINANKLYLDNKGIIWICSWGNGLYCMKNGFDSIRKFPDIGTLNRPFSIMNDSKNRYWIGTWGDGLYRFYPERNKNIYEKVKTDSNIFYDITESRKDGRLWMLSFEKLYIFDSDNENVTESELQKELPSGRVYSSILCDREDNLWIGAFDLGYVMYRKHRETPVYEMPFIKETTGFATNINCIYATDNNIMLVNQERKGLILYNTKDGKYNIPEINGHKLFEIDYIIKSSDRKSLWMAYKHMPVIFKINVPDNIDSGISFRDTAYLQKPYNGIITDIHEDRNGTLWIVTENGLYAKTSNSKTASLQKGIGKVYCIAEDNKGYIWTGSHNYITTIKKDDNNCRIIKKKEIYPASGKIEKIAVSGNSVWFTTELGGIYCYDTDSDKIRNCTHECGINDNEVIANITAGKNEIWFVTPYKIVCRKNNGKLHKIITLDDNYNKIKSFGNGRLYVNEKGEVFIGGYGGVLCIPDNNTRSTDSYHKTLISSISNNGKRIPELFFNNDTIFIPAGTKETKLSFTSLTYPAAQQFIYMLEGINSKWIFTDKNSYSANFNTLPPGSYRLLLACNKNGNLPNEGEYSIYTIIKLPLWYETIWFKIVSVLFICCIIACGIYIYVLTIKKKQKKVFEEELAKAKIDYFTQISHELLNPLTVISCVSNELNKDTENKEKLIDVIRNNISHLKRLVSQVLEMRKIEYNKLGLKVEYNDIAGFIKKKTEDNFIFLCGEKRLSLNYDICPNEIYAFFDRNKIEEILLNLLSNAIKYTPEGKNIGICIKPHNENNCKYIKITVWDEGIGISKEESKTIFNVLQTISYNKPYSNGIGLKFTKELVELHHGTICVESSPGKGSEFTVTIPAGRSSYSNDEINETNENICSLKHHKTDGTHAETILVVDDNNEILEALELILETKYKVLKADNTKTGLELLEQNNVDIIICDIKLNGENGIDFCKYLKKNINTSHIPVLMLTAIIDGDTRKACYEAGAEGFLTKPFETNVLSARIANLIEANRKKQETFITSTDNNIAVLANSGNDKSFLEQCASVINGNIDNPELNLEFLSEQLCLSRSTVNRKIKALSGLTPMDFVRNLRIKYACSLLKNSDGNISETAYKVGFSDPKYFARCFKEVTGITPSQFQKKYNK